MLKYLFIFKLQIQHKILFLYYTAQYKEYITTIGNHKPWNYIEKHEF